MESSLRISPESLRQTATRLESLSAETSRLQEALSQAWVRLDTGWEGYADTAVHEMYQEAIKEISHMAIMLSQMNNALTANAERLEAEDQTAFTEQAAANCLADPQGVRWPTPEEWVALGNSIEDWFECLQNFLSGKGWRNQAIEGMEVYYDNKNDFTADEQGLIEGGLTNFGLLIGTERLSQLIQQGAEADGNNLYVIKDGGVGGMAEHYDKAGVVSLGDTVFEENNWTYRCRPGTFYDNQNTSARISVVHEFAHAIFNGDQTPVSMIDDIFDPNNPAHRALGPNSEEALANILAYMSEAGENAPEIPPELRHCVTEEILPYLRGEAQ